MTVFERTVEYFSLKGAFETFCENIKHNVYNTVSHWSTELLSKSKHNKLFPEFLFSQNTGMLIAVENNWINIFRKGHERDGYPSEWLTIIDAVVETMRDGFNNAPEEMNTKQAAGKYYAGVASAMFETLDREKKRMMPEISAQADADDDADKSYKADDDEGVFSLKVFLSNYLNSLEYVRYTNKPRSISLYRDFVIVQDKKVNELYYKYSTDLLTAKHFGNAPESEEAFIDVILDSMDVMKDAVATLKSSYKGDTDYLRNEFSNMLDAYRTQMCNTYKQVTKIYHMLP